MAIHDTEGNGMNVKLQSIFKKLVLKISFIPRVYKDFVLIVASVDNVIIVVFNKYFSSPSSHVWSIKNNY